MSSGVEQFGLSQAIMSPYSGLLQTQNSSKTSFSMVDSGVGGWYNFIVNSSGSRISIKNDFNCANGVD